MKNWIMEIFETCTTSLLIYIFNAESSDSAYEIFLPLVVLLDLCFLFFSHSAVSRIFFNFFIACFLGGGRFLLYINKIIEYSYYTIKNINIKFRITYLYSPDSIICVYSSIIDLYHLRRELLVVVVLLNRSLFL